MSENHDYPPNTDYLDAKELHAQLMRAIRQENRYQAHRFFVALRARKRPDNRTYWAYMSFMEKD